MRKTDFRMAKYSRRGLILNFIASIFCILGGAFVHAEVDLAIVLVVGQLLITLIRGYFLFRFDYLYPMAPRRWRESYFFITLVGAAWWGVILVSITTVLGIEKETPILWLYTVIFFSTTAHAFAPYHSFLSYYQFLGLIPAAAAAVYVGGPTGYLFSILMLVFYILLTHQCRLISENYWEKLEADLALGQRETKDQEERKTQRLKYEMNVDFLNKIKATIDQSSQTLPSKPNVSDVQNILTQVRSQLDYFHKINTKTLKVQNFVFNVRHEIQFLVSEIVEKAEAQGVEVETSLASNLPMRLKGDARHFGSLVTTLLDQMLEDAKSAAVILECRFLREFENAGTIEVRVRRARKKSGMKLFSDTTERESPESLQLTVAKALALALGGEVEVLTTQSGDYQLQFTQRLEIADQNSQMDFHKNRFSGQNILLVGSHTTIVDIKRQELNALGFSTFAETQYKRIMSYLKAQIEGGTPVENILIYHEPNNADCDALLNELKDSETLRSINKLVSASPENQKQLVERGFSSTLGFYYVAKPSGLFELESTFDFIFSSKSGSSSSEVKKGSILVIGEPEHTEGIALDGGRLAGQQVTVVTQNNLLSALKNAVNPMGIVPCRERGENASKIVKIIREYEAMELKQSSFIPIIGVGDGIDVGDVAAFEIGLDDYIDLSDQRSKTLTSMIRYWRSLT